MRRPQTLVVDGLDGAGLLARSWCFKASESITRPSALRSYLEHLIDSAESAVVTFERS